MNKVGNHDFIFFYNLSYATKPSEDGMEDDDDLDEDFANEPIISGKSFQPMWVLPLYSYLDSKKQAKVG